MSVIEHTQQQTSTTTYELDTLHSSAAFAVEHNGASSYRGHVKEIEATLSIGESGIALRGSARAESIDIEEGDLRGHVLSPEFLDAERYPAIEFESTAVRYEDGEAVVDGNLTLRGQTHPVSVRGEVTGVFTDAYGANRVGVRIGTTIDRTQYGLDWQLELPNGQPVLGNDVRLDVELEFVEVR